MNKHIKNSRLIKILLHYYLKIYTVQEAIQKI